VLSIPLGVPCTTFSASNTSSDISLAAKSTPKYPERARHTAVEVAALLPIPDPCGSLEDKLMVKLGSFWFVRASIDWANTLN
jgi:hypothetical protein